MHSYTFTQFAQIMQGDIMQLPAQPLPTPPHILIDSRKLRLPSYAIFFAIVSDTNNGHDYIAELYGKGVRFFVVSQPVLLGSYSGAGVICVPNAVRALQQLAKYHRQQFGLPVIGITGSNGKTMVKEWLNQVLSPDFAIVRSPQSYNSQVGVPLSVWQLQPMHQLAIFEAGISERGEMQRLADIIQPTIGIFTNIGKAHDEGFSSVYEKTREKLLLFAQCQLLVYCLDYEIIAQTIADAHLHQPMLYNFTSLTWTRRAIAEAPMHSLTQHENGRKTQLTAIYQGQQVAVEIPFTDDASIENAIHIWLLLLYWSYDVHQIAERMNRLVSVSMRLEQKAGKNHCSIISDCYNSDLNSLAIALDFLEHQQQHARRTVILSDMLQTTLDERVLYGTIAQLLAHKKVNRLVGIGEALQRNRDLFSDVRADFYANTRDFLAAGLPFFDETILVKGARSFAFEQIVKQLSAQLHGTVLEINLNAIAHNLKSYKSLLSPSTKMMVMVKALAYGSGTFEIANVLQFSKADYLAVAYADEGVALRKAGITLPMMVMNPEPAAFDMLLAYDLEPEVYSLRHAQALLQYLADSASNSPLKIHLKMDTGMHRLGFDGADLPALIGLLQHNTQVVVASAFSHLAASESAEHRDFTRRQIATFVQQTKQLHKALGYPFLRHIANTAAILHYPEAHFDMVRLGLGLYGIDTTKKIQHKLENVSTLKTHIAQIKQLPMGETVGYSRGGVLHRASRIATVSIGYGDGLPRSLSNGKGAMWLHGQLAPIVGKICMDMTMIDVTDIAIADEGDEVIVFGHELSAEQVAGWTNTISYEIFTSVSDRVKRVYYQE